eukprot:gnl/MRDRNA2_/MRDRNA2_93355_c0_seq1.p1 gnl/MRDRNA2_/MRDRNA2_93355_c0~~gnl/MRDRNA2_/MRDRNA2_93355_c0_seq1.p1  ORF type:complete len:516 (+),score=205.27 gnl/MRDRNA2_/MRDRNA2_93355_c0_seq1:126-1673(+)
MAPHNGMFHTTMYKVPMPEGYEGVQSLTQKVERVQAVKSAQEQAAAEIKMREEAEKKKKKDMAKSKKEKKKGKKKKKKSSSSSSDSSSPSSGGKKKESGKKKRKKEEKEKLRIAQKQESLDDHDITTTQCLSSSSSDASSGSDSEDEKKKPKAKDQKILIWLRPVKVEAFSDDDQNDAKSGAKKEKGLPKEKRKKDIAKLEKKLARLKQEEEEANLKEEAEKEAGEAKLRKQEEASGSMSRQQKMDAKFKAFKEDHLASYEEALLKREEEREKQRAAALFKSEDKESVSGGKEGTESESKEKSAQEMKAGTSEKTTSIPASFVPVDILAEAKAKMKRAKAEALEKKRKEEEDAAKQKEEAEEAKRKTREAVSAIRQEKLEAKRKAHEEEYERLTKKAKEDPKTEFAGGFQLNEKIEAVVDIKIKGEIVVMQGNGGKVLGPAEIDPKEKLCVKFEKTELVVLAEEIKRPGGLPGGKEKESSKPDVKSLNKFLRDRKKTKKAGEMVLSVNGLSGLTK